MDIAKNREFGSIISTLISGNSLTAAESYSAFCSVLNNEVSDMQQGAFLAALTAKGETAEEIAGGWKAIYELDTAKVTLHNNGEVIDNCGTGMDSFKTFNISTASSIVAAAGGLTIARHGARAISSKCGTVDMAENLGVDVECSVDVVAKSIDTTGLGLFNGMSPQVHPHALGRILSQIYFGSPLNIAASLANPALPKKAVRGVYSREMMLPVINVMKEIGYTDALVVHGSIDKLGLGIDEASVCGTTWCTQLIDGDIQEFEFSPEEMGLNLSSHESIAALPDKETSTTHMISLLSGKSNGASQDIVALNSALLFLVANKVDSVKEGVEMAKSILLEEKALNKLQEWVSAQNSDPAHGTETLNNLLISL